MDNALMVSEHIIFLSNKNSFTREDLINIFDFAYDVSLGRASYNPFTKEMDTTWMPDYYRSPNDRAV